MEYETPWFTFQDSRFKIHVSRFMLDTVHVLAGLVIGKYVQNPLAAFLGGVMSHYILDWLPHWDGEQNEQLPDAKYHTDEHEHIKHTGLTQKGKQLLYYDMAATILIFLFFTAMGAVPKFWDIPAVLVFAQTHMSIVAGFFGALFPDMLLLLHLLFNWEKPKQLFMLDFHKNIQTRHTKKIWGLVTQGALTAIFIYIFLI